MKTPHLLTGLSYITFTRSIPDFRELTCFFPVKVNRLHFRCIISYPIFSIAYYYRCFWYCQWVRGKSENYVTEIQSCFLKGSLYVLYFRDILWMWCITLFPRTCWLWCPTASTVWTSTTAPLTLASVLDQRLERPGKTFSTCCTSCLVRSLICRVHTHTRLCIQTLTHTSSKWACSRNQPQDSLLEDNVAAIAVMRNLQNWYWQIIVEWHPAVPRIHADRRLKKPNLQHSHAHLLCQDLVAYKRAVCLDDAFPTRHTPPHTEGVLPIVIASLLSVLFTCFSCAWCVSYSTLSLSPPPQNHFTLLYRERMLCQMQSYLAEMIRQGRIYVCFFAWTSGGVKDLQAELTFLSLWFGYGTTHFTGTECKVCVSPCPAESHLHSKRVLHTLIYADFTSWLVLAFQPRLFLPHTPASVQR